MILEISENLKMFKYKIKKIIYLTSINLKKLKIKIRINKMINLNK